MFPRTAAFPSLSLSILPILLAFTIMLYVRTQLAFIIQTKLMLHL